MSDIHIRRTSGISNTEWYAKVNGMFIHFDNLHIDPVTDSMVELRRNGCSGNVAVIDITKYNTDITKLKERYDNEKPITIYS